jgi:Nucleotide modification associated domain 1
MYLSPPKLDLLLMNKTAEQYREVIANCLSIFEKKGKDYGTAWRVLRVSSLTDQIFIKAQRIRTIQETGINKVGEDIEGEFVAIVNYCAMGLIQIDLGSGTLEEIAVEEAVKRYIEKTDQAFSLMEDKNHDYGEAWRDMRISSLTDLIMMKILRTKQIEDNDGKTLISEGVDANYLDMLNYAVFALILINEKK